MTNVNLAYKSYKTEMTFH